MQRTLVREIVEHWSERLTQEKISAASLRRLNESAARVSRWKSND
jgi:hypothetical protein